MEARARDVVLASARAHASDFYLSALLAPLTARDDLLVLAAFLGEVARIPFIVSEPMLGEMRLQWWRDCLGQRGEGSSGNVIADEFARVVRVYDLPADTIDSLLAAQAFEIYGVSQHGPVTYDAFLDDAGAGAFKLSARVLQLDLSDKDVQYVAAIGQAYAITRLLKNLADHTARGRWVLPSHAGGLSDDAKKLSLETAVLRAKSALKRARQICPSVSAGIVMACLPAALVEPHLKALQSARSDPLSTAIDISPLSRVWALWRAKLRGKL